MPLEQVRQGLRHRITAKICRQITNADAVVRVALASPKRRDAGRAPIGDVYFRAHQLVSQGCRPSEKGEGIRSYDPASNCRHKMLPIGVQATPIATLLFGMQTAPFGIVYIWLECEGPVICDDRFVMALHF